MSALNIPGRPKADAAQGALGHVVVMLFVCLDICAKGNDSMFGSSQVLPRHDVAW